MPDLARTIPNNLNLNVVKPSHCSLFHEHLFGRGLPRRPINSRLQLIRSLDKPDSPPASTIYSFYHNRISHLSYKLTYQANIACGVFIAFKIGTRHASASIFACSLSPVLASTSQPGPMTLTPASSHIRWANSALSLKNPYPGWIVSMECSSASCTSKAISI
ncbi:hypothetical protein I7I50_06503 [Histoplasma capsulatum G186AR]|uniref:Uncharacterized protein n=1 Tax=Ajellomyces capsulatus TaxID=5037 RepID=A0A8H8D3Q8_AJECA|nr:hypothetical protein I7I52_10426 [Histoplasma capsulatum]QSS67428.1 hypothetical protein I7I50_06503 [Histoplasma capsulatum G186AR]